MSARQPGVMAGAESLAGSIAPDVAEALHKRLAAHVQGELLFTAADRGRYATDASIYQAMPAGVLVPQTHADVQAAVQACAELRVPIVPRGGGTSQCGQTVGHGLVIDHSKHLRKLLHLDAPGRTATVQPGIVLDHLNAQLKPQGLWYPVDVSTAAQATLGGMAGNNSCGSRSIAYGNMVHNVLGAEMLLADGSTLHAGPLAQSSGAALAFAERVRGLVDGLAPEIDAHWPQVMRRVGGYNLDVFRPRSERPYTADGSVNLAHLFMGAEGTLGLTQSLTLRLSPLPRAKVLGVVNFERFHTAMDSAQHIVKLGPTAVELVDRTMIELGLQNPAFAPTIRTALADANTVPNALLLVEFSGESKAEIMPKLQALEELLGDLGLPGCMVQMAEDAPQKNLWEVRKAGLNIMMSLKGDGKPVSFIEDCAVPLVHLAEYTDALTEVFARHGSRGTWYAHASVGTLHVRPILDMRREGAAKMRQIAEEASALVRKFRGAYSGEHGDGLCRGEWIRWQFGDRINEAFAAIKADLDPSNLFCPGRMVGTSAHPIPRMDDSTLFRFASGAGGEKPYRVIPLQPAFDWQAWNVQNDPRTEETTAPGTGGDPAQGFAKAVEMCNNNGHCRKFDAGTMCPSYRISRNEADSTRGRANTLRLAVSGQLPGEDIAGPSVQAALELCVGCKGCKRDCPTGVDMAKMKLEATAQHRARHGFSLKDRLIGELPRYAPWAARFAPLLNLRNRVKPLALAMEKLLGFAANRPLPAWRSDTFWRKSPAGLASQSQVLAAHAAGRPAAVLFVDTFNGFFESENAVSASKLLSVAGFITSVATKTGVHHNEPALCCGRTYLSVGMVGEAKAALSRAIAALLPYAQAGVPIVGLEPSCLLTLRDEALSLGLGEDAALVARHAMLFEEFLWREHAAGRLAGLAGKLRAINQPLLVHGHCHQKAFGVVQPMLELLKLIPGAKPQLIESSCCGMAGSFGYEAAHQAASRAMAEMSLLPALRAAPDAIVVADGTSCRHQMADLAGREAVHVAKLLGDLLV